MHFVVKTDRPDPQREIPDKLDKITLKKSVPKTNRPDTEASGYLRVHCVCSLDFHLLHLNIYLTTH